MKYTMDQFLQICSPLSTDLNIDLTLGPKDAYDILSLSKLCANRVTIHLDWAVLGGRLHLQLIRETAGKTFSETTKLLKIYLNAGYYKFVTENADILDKIPNESNSDKRSAIAIGVLEKSYLLQYNKCGNCKQDCPECETFYTGETPEQLYMRVATFLCMPDLDMIKTAYTYLSENYYSHATPTMFNAGTLRCQMASCFVLTVDDSLWSIEDHWTYTGEISRNSGGIGLDVSRIRHSQIGNSGKSDGVPGLLKPFESILVYVDQSKKRKGSAAAYLSVWHVDIEDFIEMKVPVGQGKESKTKCEDLFYGAWIPDLFVERCKQDADWTLFCPKRCPGLTEVYGKNFEDLYLRYEREGKGIKTVKAKSIVQLLFSAQTKTGVPYIAFSDRFNESSMQRNIGPIRSSNLCIEIALTTSEKEIASCNLASLCLSKFVKIQNGEKMFDFDMLAQVTRFVVRIMNNVIDRNYYPERIPQIKYANLKNRPLGIGIQGLANTFAKLDLLFDSPEANTLNNQIIQTIYYYAVDESANMAAESGAYEAFPGSPYSEGLLHPDIWRAPNGDRAKFWDKLDWSRLRNKASKGVKNSTLLALMPTATSSIIAEQEPCFEPFNFIVGSKTLISGQYTHVCKEFVEDVQKLGVWSPELSKQIYEDEENELGNLTTVKMPESIKGNKLKEARWQFILDKYRTAYEIGARESIRHAIARTPFVCQSQSLNWFVPEPSWNKFYNNFIGSWERGLKTGCYYNRGKSGMKARSAVSRCESCTG